MGGNDSKHLGLQPGQPQGPWPEFPGQDPRQDPDRDTDRHRQGEQALRELDSAVRALGRRRAARRLGLDLLRLGAIGLGLAGVAILLSRSLANLPRESASLFLLLLPIAAGIALVRALRRPISTATSATQLDVLVGATGIVCAEAELRDPRWAPAALARLATELPRAERDVPNWRRASLPALGALLFCAAALGVALPERDLDPSRRLFERQTAVLSEKLDTLVEEVGLDPSTEAELQRALERVQDELDSARPESLFEALDRLAKELEAEAERAEQTLQRAQAELAQAEQDAQRGDLDAASSELSDSLARLQSESLLSTLELAQLEGSQLADLDLGQLGQNLALEQLGLDAAQLAQLSSELRELMSGKLAELDASGLLRPGHPAKSAGQLARLAELRPHVCDENCKRKPGGT